MFNLTEIFKKEFFTIKSFPYFFIFAFIINIVMLTSFSISIDDGYSAFRTEHSMWVTQGRWTIYLLQSLILPQAVVPYFPHLIFIFFLTASYLCIIRAHDLRVNFYTYLLFPLFCAFPTWGFIAEFYANIPAVGLGLFLISIAIYLFRWFIVEPIIQNNTHTRHFFYMMMIQIFLVAIAIGAYQSFLFAFCSMGLGVIIYTRITQGLDFAKIRQCLFILIILLISSAVLYFIINNIFLYVLNTKISYIDDFYQPGFLFSEPAMVITESLKQMKKVYSSSSLYGVSFVSIGAVMLLGVYAILFNKRMIPLLGDKVIIFGLMFALALAPFSLNFLAYGFMPYRTLMGVPYVIWFFALLSLMNFQKIVRVLAMILIMVGTFQIMYANSLYAASLQLKLTHDELLANSIYQRIVEAHPDFNRDEVYQVAFYGAKYVQLPYPSVHSSYVSGSLFTWNVSRIVSYMKLIGFNNLEVAHQPDNFIPHFKDMPKWPAAGSVIVVDDVTLVKLGDKPWM